MNTFRTTATLALMLALTCGPLAALADDASTTPPTEVSAQTPILSPDPLPAIASTTPLLSTGTTTPTESTTTPSAPSGDSIATTSSTTAATSTTSTGITASASSTTNVPTPTIESGTAVAVANILNLVNTNIVNSQGALVLGNFFDPEQGTIDLRSGNPFGELACNLLSCNTGGISVHVGDNASIDNAVVLSASTGGNGITSSGNGTIRTGNAFAGLNLVNVANTNIVDSNYLLVTLNAFQGVNGDIIFPSLSNFLNQLAGSEVGNFSVDPTADVQNNVTATADSGGNSTQAASSTISTGSAESSGNVFNRINTASLGGGNVSILFRVSGNWAGQIFGAPPGLSWTRGADGSILLFGDPAAASSSLATADITGSSTAHIANNVTVAALTGSNHANVAGSALISTGNAFAGANVVNVANTSVVGRNWILAIINIFGNFNGNIAFGRPDLWVGEQVQVPQVVQNGSMVTYKYTIINNGDSVASKATLTDSQDLAHLSISTSSVPYTTDAQGHLVWQLGTIPAGQAVEVRYTAQVQNAPPGTSIANTVSVSEHETDNNTADNSDSAIITTSEPSSSGLLSAPLSFASVKDLTVAAQDDLSAITVDRATATSTALAGGTVHETLTVRNNGKGISPALTLHDVLRDPSGTIVQEQAGPVDALAPGDAVTISYDLSFAADAPAGTYTFSTLLTTGTMSAMANNNGSVVLKAGKVAGESTHTSALHRIASTVAGTVHEIQTAAQPQKKQSPIAAAAASAGVPWWVAFALFLIAAGALTLGLTLRRVRKG